MRSVSLIALVLLISCGRAPQNKEAIRSGVIEHLAKNSGLQVGSMDIEVGNVTFRDKQADATVSFRPKGAPDQGMTMNYTLEAQGNKWVVVKRADSGGGHGQPQGDLPAGHPPVTGSQGSRSGEGHPPAGQTK